MTEHVLLWYSQLEMLINLEYVLYVTILAFLTFFSHQRSSAEENQ